MAKSPDEHVGSGVDKPDPKGILEKLGDAAKAVLPTRDTEPAPAPKDTGNGTQQRLPE